ncbi:MAG TPA: sigma-70 family RNA polymerase sigma factor, partial [Cyclobacteriaceae bacterium]|nr:sigma-70 family RNA polymerase sigma factor [Cyclobacteriaceae bacterium]
MHYISDTKYNGKEMVSDSQFVGLLRRGDEQAFRQLVEEYQDKVYNTCLGFVRNEEEADDLAQEVFVEVFSSVQSFRGDSKLSTWIYRIAVTKSLELIRSKKRKKRFAVLKSVFSSVNNTPIEI